MLDKVELFIRAGRPEILPVIDQILFFLLLFFIGEGDGGFFTERRVRQYIVYTITRVRQQRIPTHDRDFAVQVTDVVQIQIHQTEFKGCDHKFGSIERFVFQEFFLCAVECIVLWVSQERLCSKEKAAASTAGVSNRLFRFRAQTGHHCFDERAGCKILPCTTFYVLGVLLQQTFVDLALHIGGHGYPVFLVDHLHHAVQDGNIADFVDGPFEDLP